jgi:hypothetical protein
MVDHRDSILSLVPEILNEHDTMEMMAQFFCHSTKSSMRTASDELSMGEDGEIVRLMSWTMHHDPTAHSPIIPSERRNIWRAISAGLFDDESIPPKDPTTHSPCIIHIRDDETRLPFRGENFSFSSAEESANLAARGLSSLELSDELVVEVHFLHTLRVFKRKGERAKGDVAIGRDGLIGELPDGERVALVPNVAWVAGWGIGEFIGALVGESGFEEDEIEISTFRTQVITCPVGILRRWHNGGE